MILLHRIFVLYFLLFELYKSSEIVIPFYSKISEISENQTPEEFIRALTFNQLYTKVKIGTPPQNLDFLIDFDNYNTYIIKYENKDKKYQRFFDNCSSTFTYIGKKEFFQDANYINAINSSDIMSIDTLKNYNLTFLHAINIRSDSTASYPGVIGFNVVPNQNPFHYESGLINQLKSKGITNNYLFTLSFNENSYNGNIIIEKNIYDKYSSEHFKSDYCLVTSNYGYYWGWNYLSVHLNSDLLEITDASIKPELGIIKLSKYYKDIFRKKFFEEKIQEGKCYEQYLINTYYYCDKDVNIDIGEFKFESKKSGLNFSLGSNDLFREYNNKKFFLIIFGMDIEKQNIKLGYPFLKKYDMIFDIDKRHVGFYNFKIKYEYKPNIEKEEKTDKNNNDINNENKNDKKDKKNEQKENSDENRNINENKSENKNEDSNSKNIIIILLIIFLILLALYFVFIIYRKCERKRKGKIFEEVFV